MLGAEAVAPRLRQGEYISVVDADCAGGWNGDAGNEIEERSLSRSAAASQSSAASHRQYEVFEVERFEIKTATERESPFTDLDPLGVAGIFAEGEVVQLIQILRGVEGRAAA